MAGETGGSRSTSSWGGSQPEEEEEDVGGNDGVRVHLLGIRLHSTSHLKRNELGAVGHHVEVRANALVLGEHLRFQRLLTSFLKL